MIIINLNGGLGNQIFQYACGRSLSLLTERTLFVNTAKYSEGLERRKFCLFDIIENNASAKLISESGLLLNKFEKLLKKVYYPIKKRGMYVISENNFFGVLNPRFDSNNLILDGYFQDVRFFLGYKVSDLITMRRSNVSLIENGSRKVIAVHIRRGDYLLPKHKIHGLIPMSFYENGILELKQFFPNALVALFSDDKDVCTTFPVDVRVSGLKLSDVEEFMLLASCDAFLISNSTFAWWAAVLSGSIYVYAPRRWYSNKDASKSFFLKDWKIA